MDIQSEEFGRAIQTSRLHQWSVVSSRTMKLHLDGWKDHSEGLNHVHIMFRPWLIFQQTDVPHLFTPLPD